MIQIVVFSYNRVLQLNTLLSSLFSRWKSPKFMVDVLYNYSGKEFAKAYELIKEEFKDKPVNFIQEVNCSGQIQFKDFFVLENIVRMKRNKRLRSPRTNFRLLLINLLEKSSCDNIMFLTDDSMFINDVRISEVDLDWLNSEPKNRQISLRLGNDAISKPVNIFADNEYCEWNMYEYTGDWGYPFSVDAHLYNKSVVLDFFRKFLFMNPNSLESYINASVKRSSFFATARCYTETKLQTFPINIVQDEIENGHQNVSVNELNQYYLEGYHMEYVFDSQIIGPKQTIKRLKLISKGGAASYVEING